MRNKFEVKIYQQLKKAKVSFKYESKRIPYILCRNYTPDFTVVTPLGLIYIETKGLFRREDKAKLAAVKRQHPEIDLRILFYAFNEKNIKWAKKNGVKYAIGVIPDEWLKGL